MLHELYWRGGKAVVSTSILVVLSSSNILNDYADSQ